jgi:hypothetical protein
MSHLGIFLRLQTSMAMMSKCGLDSTLCKHVFTNEVLDPSLSFLNLGPFFLNLYTLRSTLCTLHPTLSALYIPNP